MRLLALTLLLSFGCGRPADDHVELAHYEICWDECPAPAMSESAVRGDRIAAGARYVAQIRNAHRLPPFAVSTSDDSVLSIGSAISEEDDPERPYVLMLEAGTAGSARIIFSDRAGEVFDEAEITVVEIASLAQREAPEQAPRLMIGGSRRFYLDVHDAAGQPLLGSGAVEYTSTSEVTTERPTDGWEESGIGAPEAVLVTASSLGVATIEARAGDPSLTFEVDVVDSAAVSRIEFDSVCGIFGCLADAPQQARAFTAEGDEIHDPECQWTWNEADAPGLVSAGRNTIDFTDDEYEGTVEVTCTIDEVSASTWL